MTRSEGKAFFGKPAQLEREIKALRLQVEGLMSTLLPSGIRYDADKVQTSPRDTMADGFARIEKKLHFLEKEIVKRQLERANAIMEISAALESLRDDRERLALTAYYVGHKSVREIAKDMHYSEETVYLLMHRGIEHL